MKADEKFNLVKGKIPTKEELMLWSPEKYIQFLRFCEFFIVDNKISVTRARWQQCEELLTMPNHPFHEFLYRINFFTFDKDATEKRFYFKLVNFMKQVLATIQSNPSMVTDALRGVLEGNSKFAPALQQTKVVETAIGFPTVVPQDIEVDSGSKASIIPADVNQQLTEASLKVINLMHRLAKSITQKEIDAMPAKDRIIAVGRLSFIFNISKNLKPGKQVFNQINIHGAKREDLESALLQVTKNE